MDGGAVGAEELSAALLELEEQVVDDAEAGYATATRLEQQAVALGDEGLLMRARLCRTTLGVRIGNLAGTARKLQEIREWAARNDDRMVQARTHLTSSIIERMVGDAAKSLEHALSAVELLDETATSYTQINHRTKLADALALTGSMDAARLRYRQAEELAREAGQWRRLMVLLNNWAFSEHAAGEFERARDIAGRMVRLAEEHGVQLDPSSLHTLADIQVALGEFGEAERTMLASIARYEAGWVDDADDLAYFQLTLARAQRGLGALGRAQDTLHSCRALCEEGGLYGLLVEAYEEQAELHAARGDFAAAFAAQKEFVAAQERLRSQERDAQVQTRHAIFETAEAREDAERFREQARRDPLTGLRNRRYVDEELSALIAADPALSVALVDIDHFKRINDTLSHDTGDQVLARLATLLESGLAAAVPDGFVARLGGEEFLLVLPATPVAVAVTKLDGIRQAVSDHAWPDLPGGWCVTVSIGVAGARESFPASQSAALAAADRNLYAAKEQGRNRVVSGTPPERRPRIYRDREVT
ncbi:diguanylate cyclase (GGDEF)-like protein [Krasilnikovia cinnamomea]|uniref:Diguanylate cyclase (GGDEF)-like protein n=1 Tax=Krasilnikovia cinnamomea TaxID=349313 RepID=A0A4V2G7F7_9ACTN|nr:GGDEF domain-containing protein [Krasilnikovia cinnamomea]RZU52416.1 diguanylate cyclase (GGDEF)-like protein [Krasilnikovia cinnamomea]